MTTNTVSLSFFRFDSTLSKLWAFAMMGAARMVIGRIPDIGFWKLFGSGSGEGFTLYPNTGVYAIMATWPDLETARARTQMSDLFRKYRAKADECWTVHLQPVSSRGSWSGTEPFVVGAKAGDGPLAALTRATIRPSAVMKFWQQVPDISEVIGADTRVAFKIGLGEAPGLQQVTFSIWPNVPDMANFARKDGPHARAIKAVRDGDWFREELYARFKLLGDHGTWNGVRPLAQLEKQP